MLSFDFQDDRPLDLICMGRVAVDMYAEQIGCSIKNAQSFRKYVGGCAGNIAIGSARLGLKTMMYSCVGTDELGQFVKETLIAEGVSTTLLQDTKQHLTGLVILGINPPKHFPLLFYRNDCADMQLRAEQLDLKQLQKAKAILITGTGLSTPSMLKTTKEVVELAEQANTSVVFDLDFRPVLWGLTAIGDGENRHAFNPQVSAVYQQILPFCQLIVGTEEEFCIAGGHQNLKQAITAIQELSQAPLIVKRGEQGCDIYSYSDKSVMSYPPYPVEILNVLGAGDAFLSGLLRGLLRKHSWEEAASFANACGALVVTRHGCAPAMPYWDEMDYFIDHYSANPLIWKSLELDNYHQQATKKQELLIKKPRGFSDGVTQISSMKQTEMSFYVVKLRQKEQFQFNPNYEFAALLLTGRVRFHYDENYWIGQRNDYFSESPIVLHCPAGVRASCLAETDCELLLIETENSNCFAPMLFTGTNMLEIDERGQNTLQNRAHRLVRTVFDKRNRPESNLVLGEIISLQGGWSSYPPHYHPQLEIYHYRFSEPQGFAFAECGHDVLRIEHNDTYIIPSNKEHAHCTAPGYALYTLWFIRHQKDNPYIQPIFRQEHEWTRYQSADTRVWQPSNPLEQ